MLEDIQSKIDELFRYRKFPELLALVGESYHGNVFIDKLKLLQLKIYELDHYLETHWHIDQKELETYWVAIREVLSDCMSKNVDSEDYLSHIKMYQKHELELRKNKLPIRLKMRYFYFYKSCDVKLMRRLIYDHYPMLNRKIPQTQWRNFDFVTEINDDVEDVYEDQTTINANAFLISILVDGSVKTRNKFVDFLNEVNLSMKNMKNSHIRSLTEIVYNDTVALLENRIKDAQPNIVQKKILLEQYLDLRK